MAPPQAMSKRRDVRFLIVGGGAALALLALSWIFVAAGLPAFAGSVLAYALAFIGAYLLQRNWTFRVSHSHARSLPRYLATQLICAGLAGFAAHASALWFDATPLAVAIAATIVGSGASYLLSSRWAFR